MGFVSGFLRFIKRPEINEQNTGRDAFQQYQGYSRSDVKGNGGWMVLRSMNATNPANIAVGNTLKRNDPTVTGNVGDTIPLLPLSQESVASF